jgi:hypothetical protein
MTRQGRRRLVEQKKIQISLQRHFVSDDIYMLIYFSTCTYHSLVFCNECLLCVVFVYIVVQHLNV